MITFNDKQYRNLEEQVLQNKNDIEYLLNEGSALNEFGITVVGVINNASELPDPTTYEGNFGDTYAVGIEAPYTLYVFTRQVSGQTGSWWFNIGLFPAPSTVPGPIGPQGIQGETGIRGSLWYSQSGVPTNTNGVLSNDQAVNGLNGDLYQFVNGGWQLTGNIRGPQGIQGIQGVQGNVGPVGPTGPQGPKGDQGQFIQILGTLDNINQLPMPDSVPRYAAYLIPISGVNHVYLIVGEGTSTNPIEWVDAGMFNGTGTKVTIDGVEQNEAELGYVPKISTSYQIGEDTTVSSNGSEITFSNLQITGYNINNEQIEGMGTIELPIASSDSVNIAVENNTVKAQVDDGWLDSWIVSNINIESPKVQITAPTTSTNGQLTAEQLSTLQNNNDAYLMFNNEVYRLQDVQHTTGYLVYSHVGFDNISTITKIKCITITISTRGWVLTEQDVGAGGGKLYRHYINVKFNSTSNPSYTDVWLEIITSDPTPYNSTTIKDLYALGGTTIYRTKVSRGTYNSTVYVTDLQFNSSYWFVYYPYVTKINGSLEWKYEQYQLSQTNFTTLIDTVTDV